jgi:hypothetical protein
VLGAANPAIGPFLSPFLIAIPICRELGIDIAIDFLLLNTVQLGFAQK